MIVVDSALGGGSPRVRLAAVELTYALCPLLPVEVLGQQLSGLVVTLFPLLEGETAAGGGSDGAGILCGSGQVNAGGSSTGGLTGATQALTAGTVSAKSPNTRVAHTVRAAPTTPVHPLVQLAGVDLAHYGRLHSSFTPTHIARTAQTSGTDSSAFSALPVPPVLLHLYETQYAVQLSAKYTHKAKRLAVGIIKQLFIERREDIQQYMHSVAYIPNIKELKIVHDLHQQEVRSMSLEQSLLLLCDMLTHSSSHVRLVAVNRISIVCRENKAQLIRILDATADSTVTEHILSTLLQSLLKLCAVESEPRVQLACAVCLGELGAVDPSRVSVRLSKASPFATHTSGTSASEPSAEQKQRDAFPWYAAPATLGMFLLEHHLVPGLRSAAGSASQDKSGYAIQVILKHIAENLSPDSDVNSDTLSLPSLPTLPHSMPEALKTTLFAKNILDVTEPFWSTSYTMDERYAVRTPPIYFPGLSFARWISLFTRFLICNSKGVLAPIFMACRGVIRIRTELCQYLLPLLIYDVLTTHDRAASITASDPNGSAPHTRQYLNLIIQELCLVLQGAVGGGETSTTATTSITTNNSDQMCVQSVFSLLDTLQAWVGRCSHKEGLSYVRIPPTGRSPTITPAMACRYGFDSNGMECVKMLVEAVPMELLSSAALGIKAYARALRYLETHARVVHRVETFGVYSYARKSAPNDYFIHHAEEAMQRYKEERNGSNSMCIIDSKAHKGTILCTDRAGGMLPVLCSSQLNAFMTIFAALEEPDSLQGALVLNHIYGYSPSMWHRILELEMTDDWLGALLEYGLIHNSQMYSNALHCYIRNSNTNNSGNDSTALVRRNTGRSVSSNSSSSSTADMEVVTTRGVQHTKANGNINSSTSAPTLPLSEVVELERRKLRCMVELGHYEAVIDQVFECSVEAIPL